jgi:hypothetical protein
VETHFAQVKVIDEFVKLKDEELERPELLIDHLLRR